MGVNLTQEIDLHGRKMFLLNLLQECISSDDFCILFKALYTASDWKSFILRKALHTVLFKRKNTNL